MSGEAANHVIAIGLVIGLAGTCAAVLKSARTPGWHVLGGLLAGLLLGPSILGRAMPDRHESLFVGGAAQRQAIDDLRHKHERDQAIALETGAGDERLRNLQSQHATALADADSTMTAVRWDHQQPMRIFLSIIVSLTLLGAATRHIRHRDRRQGLIAPLTIGLWAAVLPGMAAFALTRWLWPHELDVAVLAAAAMAIGPWALGETDREAADRAEHGGAHMIQLAGRVASVIGLAAAGWALWSIVDGGPALGALPMLALPLGWLLPTMRGPLVRRTIDHLLLPTLAALAMLRIDVIEDANLWLILLFMILAGDGRWIGALIGALALGGRKSLRTMRLIMGMMSCGPTMLSLTAIGMHIHALPADIALALVLGAGLIEATTPARRSVARQLAEAEEEIDEIQREID